jgi:hypothetical protein
MALWRSRSGALGVKCSSRAANMVCAIALLANVS